MIWYFNYYCLRLYNLLFLSNYQMDIEEQLETILWALIKNISASSNSNFKLPDSVEFEDLVTDYKFYSQISNLLFPHLELEITDINEMDQLDDADKLQELLFLIGGELELEILEKLSGEKIINGNLDDIYKLVSILMEVSKAFSKELSQSIKSDKNLKKKVRTED